MKEKCLEENKTLGIGKDYITTHLKFSTTKQSCKKYIK